MTITTITKEQFYRMTANEIATMFAEKIPSVNGKKGQGTKDFWYKKIRRYGKDWAWYHNEFFRNCATPI